MELSVISLSITGLILYIQRAIITSRILKFFNATHGNAYIKMQIVAALDELFGYIIAFTVFIAIIKFIRILRFNKRMGFLYSTLAQCSHDLKSFLIVFVIVFFAFVQMFSLLFGLHMLDFSSLVNSAETSFGMMTGKFDFESMCNAQPILGPLAFFIFILMAPMVLLNIFLTLIISAFETVKHDLMKQNNEFEIMDFALNKFKAMLGFGGTEDYGPLERQEDKLNAIEETLNNFPDKIDQMLLYLNDAYYEGKLELNRERILSRKLSIWSMGGPYGMVPSAVSARGSVVSARSRTSKSRIVPGVQTPEVKDAGEDEFVRRESNKKKRFYDAAKKSRRSNAASPTSQVPTLLSWMEVNENQLGSSKRNNNQNNHRSSHF